MKTKRKQRHPRILTGSNKALKVVCEDVVFDETWISCDIIEKIAPISARKVIRDMTYCLTKRKNGVGLAANQIGSNLRIIIVKTRPDIGKHMDTRYEVMINPVIENKSDKTNTRIEGCLSYPGITKHIERSIGIVVQYNTVSGEEVYVKFSNFFARIIQHEIDHLDGLCKVGL